MSPSFCARLSSSHSVSVRQNLAPAGTGQVALRGPALAPWRRTRWELCAVWRKRQEGRFRSKMGHQEDDSSPARRSWTTCASSCCASCQTRRRRPGARPALRPRRFGVRLCHIPPCGPGRTACCGHHARCCHAAARAAALSLRARHPRGGWPCHDAERQAPSRGLCCVAGRTSRCPRGREEVERMSVKDLKALLASRGVDTRSFLERSEFVARAKALL